MNRSDFSVTFVLIFVPRVKMFPIWAGNLWTVTHRYPRWRSVRPSRREETRTPLYMKKSLCFKIGRIVLTNLRSPFCLIKPTWQPRRKRASIPGGSSRPLSINSTISFFQVKPSLHLWIRAWLWTGGRCCWMSSMAFTFLIRVLWLEMSAHEQNRK